jgi:phosphoadenosine phosphosulfate reductase
MVVASFPGATIATTSGGIQSGLLLAQLARLRTSSHDEVRASVAQLPIIFLDTGDLFPETVAYVAQLKAQLGLNIVRFRHGLSHEELQENLDILQRGGLSRQSAFDELTKVRPMSTLLARYKAKVWISGNRRDQSQSRAHLPYVLVQNEMLKIFPLADLKGGEVRGLLSSFDIPQHPLANRYRSVGNQGDTRESQGPYEKSGRHSSLKEECGLHERGARNGKTLLKSGYGFRAHDQMPVIQIDL